jgi:hypothetical protein
LQSREWNFFYFGGIWVIEKTNEIMHNQLSYRVFVPEYFITILFQVVQCLKAVIQKTKTTLKHFIFLG